MEEKLELVLDMYKKGDTTDYVVEREIGEFLGNRYSVKLAKDSKNTQTTSYCCFPIPEFLAEGFHITYYIDSNAIKSLFDSKQLVLLFSRLKAKEQDIFKKFNIFLKECNEKEISLDYYIGFLLSLYILIREDLVFGEEQTFLPDESELLKLVDKFTMEQAREEDIEKLLIDEFVCPEIIDLARNKVESLNTGAMIRVKFSNGPVEERPTINLGQQEIVQHVSSTFGTRSHTEIPHDFKPSTNQ